MDLDEGGLDDINAPPSVNAHLLYDTHSLFINDRAEVGLDSRLGVISNNFGNNV